MPAVWFRLLGLGPRVEDKEFGVWGLGVGVLIREYGLDLGFQGAPQPRCILACVPLFSLGLRWFSLAFKFTWFSLALMLRWFSLALRLTRRCQIYHLPCLFYGLGVIVRVGRLGFRVWV